MVGAAGNGQARGPRERAVLVALVFVYFSSSLGAIEES